jgi:hypothetical protein
MTFLTRLIRHCGWVSLGAVSAAGLAAAAPAAAPSALQPAAWQHHQETMNYFGMTSSYTCTGLEDKTRRILLYFGARPDLKVSASCYDPIRPVEQAVVHADFYTLAPAPAGSSNAVSARWVVRVLSPRHPDFMGSGECELVRQLKGLLTQGFTLRDVNYHTGCVAHEITIADYRVSTQVLEPADIE